MNKLHRYVATEIIRTLILCSMGFTALFLIFEFFDRIDILMAEGAPLSTILIFFAYKIPPILNVTLPIAMLVSVLFTIGILSKNSEFTAMRAGGLTVLWIARPILIIAFSLSLISIAINELVVPHCMRRVREIYNIDIRGKDKSGEYSQQDLWWRSGNSFFTANAFDSRTNELHELNQFEVNSAFRVVRRMQSVKTNWVNDLYGWSMEGVTQFFFKDYELQETSVIASQTLPIPEKPEDFYDAETDPQTMSFLQLQNFIQKQEQSGLSAKKYYADLYAKLAFPFVIFICTLVVLPFAIKPARTGSMAAGFLFGLAVGFLYYVVHSFSLAMGRAEFWHPLVAAWMANVLMAVVGMILIIGVEAPE